MRSVSMSFDGFFTHVITEELKEKLLGGRINKIYQPFEQEIHFQIRANRTNYRLLASIHPVYYRLHLNQERPANPQNAPMFNMILRKHIENSSILNIHQVDNDRIIVFELSGRDEIGDLRPYLLIFELMGKHSNLLLVEGQNKTIIDCIKHVSPLLNSYRGLQPGADYILPPQSDQQENIMAMSDQELVAFSLKHHQEIEEGQAHKVIQGLSKMGNQQIHKWIHNDQLSPYKALSQFKENVNEPKPTLFRDGRQLNYYFMNLDYLEGRVEFFSDPSSLVEQFYKNKVHSDRLKQLSGNIYQKIKQILNRNATKLKKLNANKKKALNSENYRIFGELLSAYAFQIPKGSPNASVPNYYDNNEMLEIPLDTSKSTIENSQAYFKKYAKYRDSLKYIDHQVSKTKQENDYLEGILIQLQQAEIEDVEDIKEELIDQGYFKQRKTSIKKRAKSTSSPRLFQTKDGTNIRVGRNNKQNDALSLKNSSKNYWWLHTKDIPGAHVVIESDDPSDQAFSLAAMIAAYYSKASLSANVPVDTVQVKHLRKPKGAKPGFVIYEGQSTLYTTPNPKLIEQSQVK